jgi:hypothetical protein
VLLDSSIFAFMATHFFVSSNKEVSKKMPPLPWCLTLCSVFWDGGQELAARGRRSNILPFIRPNTLP